MGSAPRVPSGRRVHITCFVLALLGGGSALLGTSGSPGEFLGALLLLGSLLGWGWYSGPWRTFLRSGKPGWLSVVPFLNGVVLLQIARRSGWWMPLWFVPVAHLMVGFVVFTSLSRRFNRSPVVPVLLFLTVSAPFYVAAMTWLKIGIFEYYAYGHFDVIVSLGIKAIYAGVLLSVLFGCLPLGLARMPEADVD